MILDKIILQDFGVYGGRHEIDLTPPSPAKPVILFGGLNGAGKTTLLDAIKLCMFGAAARCSARDTTAYNDFLLMNINKNAKLKQSSLELDFRHIRDGVETCYQLKRAWKATKKSVSEKFTVNVDSNPTESVAQNWLQHVESIVPANIANLFFFDGEQAASYATPENATQLVETGVLSLLGLDVIDRLGKDLRILERKTKKSWHKKEKKFESDFLRTEIATQQSRLSELRMTLTPLSIDELVPAQEKFSQITEDFRKVGGELWAARTKLEQNAQQADVELSECRDRLHALVAGCLPLRLVKGLIDQLEDRSRKEQDIILARKATDIVARHNKKAVSFLRKNSAAKRALDLLSDFGKREIKDLKKISSQKISDIMDEDSLLGTRQLLLHQMPDAHNKGITILAEYKLLAKKQKSEQLKLASIPDSDVVRPLLLERDRLTKLISQLEAKHAQLTAEIDFKRREIIRLEASLDALALSDADELVEQDDTNRMISYSAKARTNLHLFRTAIIKHHLSKIESLVLESYQCLFRKKSLVGNIRINPDDFSLTIFDSNLQAMSPESLSAGERQLLAISLLWGMAKASGRPLPTAIDTPLGRLDSVHRELLVKNYFPFASHQVLLFSTDEELYGDYLKDLKPRVGRSYSLEFNDDTGNTSIAKGYFNS